MSEIEKWVHGSFYRHLPMIINPEKFNNIGFFKRKKRVFDPKTKEMIPVEGLFMSSLKNDARLVTAGELINDWRGPRYAVTLKITSHYDHLSLRKINGIIRLPEQRERLDDRELAKMDAEIGALVESIVAHEPDLNVQMTIREAFIDELGHALGRSDQLTYDQYLERQRNLLPQKINDFMDKWGDSARAPEPETKIIQGTSRNTKPDVKTKPRRFSRNLALITAASVGFCAGIFQTSPEVSLQEYRHDAPIQQVSYPHHHTQAPFNDVVREASSLGTFPGNPIQSTRYVEVQPSRQRMFIYVQPSDYLNTPTPTNLNECAQAVLRQLIPLSNRPSLEQTIKFGISSQGYQIQDIKPGEIPSILNTNPGPDDEYDLKLDDAIYRKDLKLQHRKAIFSSETKPPFEGELPGNNQINYFR